MNPAVVIFCHTRLPLFSVINPAAVIFCHEPSCRYSLSWTWLPLFSVMNPAAVILCRELGCHYFLSWTQLPSFSVVNPAAVILCRELGCRYFLSWTQLPSFSVMNMAAVILCHEPGCRYSLSWTWLPLVVTSRIDYCNSVIYGARAAHIQPLQNVLNGAAWLILHKRKYDHITSDIRDRLHWLPIQQRLEYKICLLIFKCLHQTAPA